MPCFAARTSEDAVDEGALRDVCSKQFGSSLDMKVSSSACSTAMLMLALYAYAPYTCSTLTLHAPCSCSTFIFPYEGQLRNHKIIVRHWKRRGIPDLPRVREKQLSQCCFILGRSWPIETFAFEQSRRRIGRIVRLNECSSGR
jgi:hypothetical protein